MLRQFENAYYVLDGLYSGSGIVKVFYIVSVLSSTKLFALSVT